MKKNVLFFCGILTVSTLLAACGETPAPASEADEKPTAAAEQNNVTDDASDDTEPETGDVEKDQEAEEDQDTGEKPFDDVQVSQGKWISLSLTKIDEVPRSDSATINYSVSKDDKVYITDVAGRIVEDQEYYDADMLFDDLLKVRKNDPDNYPNVCGVVKRDGTEVFPCSASIIETLNSRFLAVTIGTQQVQNKDDAFFYITDRMISLDADDDDLLYAGYTQIYDMERKAFVGDFKNDKPGAKIYAIGDILYYQASFRDPVKIMNADGEELASGDYSYEPSWGNCLLRKDGDDSCTVLDPELKEIAQLNYLPDKIYGEGKCYSDNEKADDGKYYSHLYDEKKNLISDHAYLYAPNVCGNLLYERSSSSSGTKGSIYTMDGTKVIDGEMEIESVTEMDGGFLLLKDGDNKILIYPDGSMSETFTVGGYASFASNGEKEAFIVDQGKTEALGNKLDSLGCPWIVGDIDSKKEALFSLIDGTQLLPYEYDQIQYANGYIYADKEGIREVYKVNISY